MAETAHIAEIAEKLSDELFGEFLWQKTGPTNQNWSCEDQEHHHVSTHPSDVVFFYDEPYYPVRTYINCDLKSYSRASITRASIEKAIVSLAMQISCAERSDEWQQLYTHSHVSPEICRLLFVYNHDGQYDREFSSLIQSIKADKLEIPRRSKIVVLGPEDIFWLDNVRYDIRQMRGSSGRDQLPARSSCRYFYPDLVRAARIQEARAASLEMLTSPWIILEYERSDDGGAGGVIVFYRRPGETTQEFMYLIDYLRHYQVINQRREISIRLLDNSGRAVINFQKAAQQYIDEMGGKSNNTELEDRVKRIKISSMSQVISQFSSIELGMDYD